MNFFNINKTNISASNSFCVFSSSYISELQEALAPSTVSEISRRAGQRRLRTENSTAIQAFPGELVDALIKYGNNQDGIPSLHAAIKAGDERIVRLFLDHNADPNAHILGAHIGNEAPISALDFAAAFGNSNLVNLLIDRGAIVNPPEWRMTPLMCAAKFNNPETIRCLAERGADLHIIRAYDWNALHIAAVYNSTRAAETLIALGLSPNTSNSYGITPLMQACSWSRESETSFSIIETLLRLGANPNLKNNNSGSSALHSIILNAGEKNKLQIAEILIKYGLDINSRDKSGRTPLCYAQDPTMRAWLIQNGAIE